MLQAVQWRYHTPRSEQLRKLYGPQVSSLVKVLPAVSGRMIFPPGILHQPMGLTVHFFFCIFYFPLVITIKSWQHLVRACHQNINRLHWPICLASRSPGLASGDSINRRSQIASRRAKIFSLVLMASSGGLLFFFYRSHHGHA